MWVARNKDGNLVMFADKPVRSFSWKDDSKEERNEFWTRDTDLYPSVHFASKTALYNPHYQLTYLDNELFPELKWEDEPIEVDLVPRD